MEPPSDIDPSWWSGAFGQDVAPYEAAELLSMRLRVVADADDLGGLQRQVLDTLAVASSAMLRPGNWLEPFSPMAQFGDRRSPLPSDLTPEQIALLARIAPLVDRADLRARAADVAWFYGERSNVGLLDLAIDGYAAAPLDGDGWFRVGKLAWRRALELANRRGQGGRTQVERMSRTLADQLLAFGAGDRFRVPDLAALLRESGRVSETDRVAITEHLLRLAEEAREGNPRLSRHLDREAAAWLGGSNTDAVNAALERIARTYIAEADQRLVAQPDTGPMIEGTFLEKAIATFRRLPRSYRSANRIDGLIDSLRDRLQLSREATLESMIHFTTDPVDLTDTIAYAHERMRGCEDRLEALVRLVTLAPAIDADRVRADTAEMLEGSLSRLFGSATFSRDARKVSATEGGVGGAQDPSLDQEVARHVMLQTQLVAQGLIWPALEVLTLEHRYDRDYITSLCAESATVPERHAALWGVGLTLGLQRDFGPAVAVLVPQLEHMIRLLLKARGVHTLFVDERTGVESEKSLNALLETAEAVELLGPGMVLELQTLLLDPGGMNLRNDIAHGLLDDAEAWSLGSMYIWWFCMRLALWPVTQVVIADRAAGASERTEGTPDATGSGTVDGAALDET
jgi:hypothetical protein